MKNTNRWIILIAHIGVNIVLGGVYAFTIFATPLAEQFGWSKPDIMIAFSINMGIIPIPMVLGGKLLDQGKGKTAILLGGILFSLGFILTGFAKSLPMLYLTYGLIAGVGSGICFTGTLNNSLKFFPDKRGLASGLVLSGVGIGTMLCSMIATNLLNSFGATQAFLYLGIGYLVLILVLSFFIQSAPAAGYQVAGASTQAKATKATAAPKTTVIDKNWKEMLQDPRFYVMALILALGAFSGMMVSSNAAQIGQQMFAITAAVAAVVVSLNSIFNSLGRIIWGSVSDKLGQYTTLILIYGLLGVCMILLRIANGNTMFFYIAAVGTGFCYAGVLSVFPSLTSNTFGLKNQGLNYAFMYIGFSIAAFAGPRIAASLAETAGGSYNLPFVIALVLIAIGIGLLFLLKKMQAKKING